MKRNLLICLALLFVALCGCRARLLDAPERADEVVETAQPTPTPTPTPEPTLEPSQEPSPEPTQPDEPPEPVSTEGGGVPDRPANLSAVSGLGTGQLEEVTALGVTVTYNPNGGDGAPVSTVVNTGEPYGLQPEGARRGYSFDGWWTAPVGGRQILPDTVVERAGPHTLYAHWRARPASMISFDGGGGRVKSRDAIREVSEGDALGTLPVPLREGYGFDGWFTLPEGGEQVHEDTVYTGPEDWTLYAHWTYDPYEFWSFTLKNRTQQVYLCQQASIYFETKTDQVTAQSCPLITAIGGQNIAENREDPNVTDDWVLAKRPQVVLKEVASLADAAKVQAAMSARFPEQKVVLVTSGGLGSGAQGLYARLALAKELYGDWYTDVDLSIVAAELGVDASPIYFG